MNRLQIAFVIVMWVILLMGAMIVRSEIERDEIVQNITSK